MLLYSASKSESTMPGYNITEIAIGLILIGFILAVISMIIMARSGSGKGSEHRAAGILLIGPIPIMFGTDRESVKILVVLAIVLILLILTLIVVPSIFLGR